MVAIINYTKNTAPFSQVLKSSAAKPQANTASADSLSANNADTVTLSPEAQALLAAQSGGGSTSSAVATSAAGSTTTNSATFETTKIDFTNMTPNQAASLRKSGAIPSTMVLPLTNAQLQLAQYDPPIQAQIDAANNTPANFMQMLENTIKSDKSMGMDTSFMEKELNEMTDLQGKTVSNSTATQPDSAASANASASNATS
jgi:hypothetical protein